VIPKSYKNYSRGTLCSAMDCDQPAEYEVYLYDYYPQPINEEFFEQDSTCPFLCDDHMRENEERAVGDRIPRGRVAYPYTNRNGAQGYSRYVPLRDVFPQLFDGTPVLQQPSARLEIVEVNDELLRYLSRYPELLRELDPRKFEEIVAKIFEDRDFEVVLTPQTRDGGKDLYAVRRDDISLLLYLVECKRYASSRKVGVEAVRALYGVKDAERASHAVLVTTSSFTKDAIEFATPLKYHLSLQDFDALKSWLGNYS